MNNRDLYRFVSGRVTPGCSSLVRAHSKSGFAAPRRTMNVHHVDEMVALRDGDGIRFAARWVCGNGSVDVVPIADADEFGGACERCDKRLEDLAFGLIVVYRCYGQAGDLLYIGSTTNGSSSRIDAHKKSAWWPLVDPSLTRLERFDHEFQARAAELRAIRTEHPQFNVQGRRSA